MPSRPRQQPIMAPAADDSSVSFSTIQEDNFTQADDRTVVASNATTGAAVASWQHPHPGDEHLGREEAPMIEEESHEYDSESSSGNTGKQHSLKNGKVAPFVTTLAGIDEKGGTSSRQRRSIRFRKNGKVDWSLVGILSAVLLVVLAVIIGTILGTRGRDNSDNAESNSVYNNGTFPPMLEDDIDGRATLPGTETPTVPEAIDAETEFPEIATFPPEATEAAVTQEPTDSSQSTSSACTRVIKTFPNDTVVSLEFEVVSDISQGEIGYANHLFHKIFNSLAATCDAQHCRHIATQRQIWDRVSNSTILSVNECDAILEIQLELNGTYLGCAEAEGTSDFIGLFFEPANESNRQRRNMLRHATLDADRLLQQDSFGKCLTSLTLGSAAPECVAQSRSAAVVDMMNDMAHTIPSVCRLESVQDGPL